MAVEEKTIAEKASALAEEASRVSEQAEIGDRVNRLLNWVEETARQTTDFASDQVPLYVQELLAWNFAISLVWFGVHVVLLSAVAYFFKKYTFVKERWTEKDRYSEWPWDVRGTTTFVGTLVCLATTLVVFCNLNLDWLKIKLAPRVWLVEYISDLVK